MSDRISAAQMAGASLSGNERNHLFWNRGGLAFEELSGISGLDDPADGRSFAILDYDRDGWLDVAVANANAPRLALFRNRIGETGAPGRVVGFRFAGGNRTPRAAPGRSSRDGYGAVVALRLGERTLVREHRAGEGLAAQNSATLVIGIGDAAVVPRAEVRWPSGRIQVLGDLPAGTLVTVYEDPAHGPGGAPFTVAPYRRAPPEPGPRPPSRAGPRLAALAAAPGGPRLRLLTTLATWCVACATEVPALDRVRALVAPADLEMLGVPVDPNDRPEMLDAWMAEHRPAYRLLHRMSAAGRAELAAHVRDTLGREAVPASVVADADGRVLLTRWGPPTVSEIRRLLWENR